MKSDSKKEILKKYVCKMPFTYTDVQWNSQWICCPSWAPKNIRVNKNGRPNRHPINKYDNVMRNWLSDSAYKIRKSVLDGSYRYCDHKICPKLNQLINTQTIPFGFDEIEKFKKKNNIESEEDIKKFNSPPEEILFGFDRSCNFKCPSCRLNLIPNDIPNSIEYKRKLHLLQSIEDNFSKNLKIIIITGSGDPFYSKIYRDYLINFDAKKYPKLEQIQVITNANLLDEKLWNSMKATPYIKTIEVSIDASTKDTYENKTRINGKWEKLIKNLNFLSTQDNIIEQFVCSMVVSKHNYKEMEMFYNLITNIFKDSNFKWGVRINYRQIVDWNTYNPEELKELQIFNKEHILHSDFKKELKKVDEKMYRTPKFIISHNFHHVWNE